jgi:hypothetical protein
MPEKSAKTPEKKKARQSYHRALKHIFHAAAPRLMLKTYPASSSVGKYTFPELRHMPSA